MSDTIVQEDLDLQRRRQSRQLRLTDTDKPDFHGQRGSATNYFEETDEKVSLRFGDATDAQRGLSYREQRRANNSLLKSAGYQPWGEFKSARDFIDAGFNGGGRFQERVHRHFAAVQGMSEGSGSDGGYLVMPEFGNRILDRVYGNSLFSRTDHYTVNGNSMTFLANSETSRAAGSRHGGIRGYWIPEAGAIPKSKPTFRQISMKLLKLGVVVYLTDELMSDGGDILVNYIARKAADEINFIVGDAIFNGIGTGQPLGILNAPSLVSVAKEEGQLPGTIETENIVRMFSRFFAPNLGGARWYHNQDVSPELNLMTPGVGTGGVTTFMPPGGLRDAPYATLQGRPMEATEFNPTLGTVGDLVLADLGQILSISKGGIGQAVSMHVEFLTDQTALRFIFRLNFTPWETAPITPDTGATKSPARLSALAMRMRHQAAKRRTG